MADYRLQYIIRATDQASRIFAGTNAELGRLGKQAQKMGKAMTLGLTMPIVAMGVAAVKAGGDLDTEMRNIQSISKQTGAEIDRMAASFIEMSTDINRTTDTAAGLASAFYTIQGSGFQGAEAMEVLEASTLAASAGLTRTEVAASATSAKLNAYGESASEAAATSDLMFRTVDIGVGTFSELANSLGYVVGTAAQAGVSFDEVSAALSTMSKQGIDFQRGGRALNALILAMIDPSDQMAEALEKIGYRSGQAALDTLGLAGVLRQLEVAGYGGTEGMASLGLSTYSLRAALALTGEGARTFTQDLEAMADAEGAAKEAFDVQVQSFQAQVKNLQNTLNSALIPAGTRLIRDVLIPMGKELTPLIRSIADLDPETMKWALRLAGVAAVAGPLLTTIGRLSGLYTTLATSMGLATTAAVTKTGAMQTQSAVEVGAAATAGKLAVVFGTLGAAMAVVGFVLGMVAGSYELQRRLLEGHEKQVRGASETYAEYSDRMDAVQARMALLSKLHPALEAGWTALTGAQQLGIITMRLSEEGWDDLTAATWEATVAANAMTESEKQIEEAMHAVWVKIAESPLIDLTLGINTAANAWENYAEKAETGSRSMDYIMEQAALLRQEWEKHEAATAAWSRSMDQIVGIAQSGYSRLLEGAVSYAQQMLDAEEQGAWDRQMSELNFQAARQVQTQTYQQEVLQSEAEHQAQVLALQMQGKDAELGNLQIAHEEELAQLAYRFSNAESQAAYSYGRQQALAIVNGKRQVYLQAVAQQAQLKQDLAYYSEQASLWLTQNENLFKGQVYYYEHLLGALGAYHTSALKTEQAAVAGHIRLQEIQAEATQKGALATMVAIKQVIWAYEAALDAAAGNIDKAKGQIEDAMSALRGITLELPSVPDWTQFMPDFGDAATRAGRAAGGAGGAARAASSQIIDFEDVVRGAIEALDLLAGYEAPEGFALGAQSLKNALIEVIPILRELDDVLDATISQEGMEKVSQFADTIAKVASSVDSLQKLAAFRRPEDWTGPFEALQEVMTDLAWSFEVAQETWDEYLSKDQITEIGSFADSVFKLAEAMGAFRSLSKMAPTGENWVEEFLAGFLENLDALALGLSEIEQADYMDDLSLPFVELLGATGQAIQNAQDGLLAIASRWQVGDMRGATDDFIADIDYVLGSLAEKEGDWSDLDFSGTLAFLTGVVGEITDLVGNLSTEFRELTQPIGYQLMMGIADGIQDAAPEVLQMLLDAVGGVVAGAGGGHYFPESGEELAGGPGAGVQRLVLAPIILEGDTYRDAGGALDYARIGDEAMREYEHQMR